METPRRIRRLLRMPGATGRRLAEEVDAEIELHLELRTEQLVREGLSFSAARAEALRRFGHIGSARTLLESTSVQRERRMRVREGFSSLSQDLLHAFRGILRERGASLVVIATLAIGIGANAAVFGVVDRLLLSGPAHVQDAERVVRLYLTRPPSAITGGEMTQPTAPYPVFDAIRAGSTTFTDVAAFSSRGPQLLGGAEGGEEVRVAAASWNLFPLLGVEPLVGRFFGEDEDRPPTGELLAVLGHTLWRRRFGADPAVIGTTVRLGPREYTIVGVAPANFAGPQFETIDAWVPLSASGAQTQQWTNWNSRWLHAIGRLAPGITIEAAAAETEALFRGAYRESLQGLGTGQLRFMEMQWGNLRTSLAPIRFDYEGREPLETRVSRWLLGVSLMLLLIACTNVASLQLARGVRRGRDSALRLALGSSRGRLLRASLARSLMLALLGGGAALLLAQLGGGALRRLVAPAVAWEGAPIDGRVFVFAFLATLATALLIGILPALQWARPDAVGGLHRGASGQRVRHTRLLGCLTVAQTAAATLLLVGSGLFARSLANVLDIPLGVEAEGVWTASPVGGGLANEETFYEAALARLTGVPAVDAVAVAIGTPFENAFSQSIDVPGFDSLPELAGGGPYVNAVTPGYFETVGTRVLRGRSFTDGEGAGTEPVVVVNRTMADVLWPGADPLTKCLGLDREDRACVRVVGVVEDTKRLSMHDASAMQYYVPFGQEDGIGGSNLIFRPRDQATETLVEIRALLRDVAGPSTFLRFARWEDRLDPEVRPWRAGATLFALFGALALAVAAFGVYGVVAYSVAQRTNEIGVRMALGAHSSRVARMVLRQGMVLVLLGLCVGVLLAVAGGRLIQPALFQVSPTDPAVLSAAAVVLLAVAALATLIPSLRAARVDPLVAIRSE